MKLFRDDNTDGYTDSELDSFNREFKNRVMKLELEEGSYKYDIRAKEFSDEVSRRG